MEKFEEKLIILIKENPALYAKASKDYRNNNKKERAWTSIAAQLNMNVEVVKKRWRSLRDRFVREARKLEEQSRSGAGEDSTVPSWPYFEELKFLQSHTEARQTSSNYQNHSLSEESHGQDADSGSEYNFDNSSTPSTTPTAQSSRRRKRALDTDEHFQGILEKVEQQVDDWSAKKLKHESFCMYLAERMEMLPESVGRTLEVEFISKVNQAINEFNELIDTNEFNELIDTNDVI